MTETSEQLVWHKVLSKEELPEGRVLGEFLFMQQLASEKVHCSVISMNSCGVLRLVVDARR
jgi:hypothetical protein